MLSFYFFAISFAPWAYFALSSLPVRLIPSSHALPVKFRLPAVYAFTRPRIVVMAAVLFNSFKASTAAISSRSLARSAPRHLLAMTRRHYSEEKPPNSAPEQETGNKSEEGAKADDKLAELTKKLEAKEAEVTDLTVSCFCSYDSFFFVLTKLYL